MDKEKLFYFLTLPEDRVLILAISLIQEPLLDTLDLRGADFSSAFWEARWAPFRDLQLYSSPNWFTQYALQIGLCTFATI